MIPVICGFAVASVILLLTFALISAHWMLERANELYKIACDDSREWKEKYRILVEQTAEERIKHGTMSNLKARANYYAERDRERRTVTSSNELERSEGVG